MGLRDGQAAIDRGEMPGDEGLARAVKIIASSRALKRLAAESEGAAADEGR